MFQICNSLLLLIHLYQVREILKDLWENEHDFCSFIGDLWQSGSEKIDYSMFFLESVLVPPIKFRPSTKGGDSVSNSLQMILFGRFYILSNF